MTLPSRIWSRQRLRRERRRRRRSGEGRKDLNSKAPHGDGSAQAANEATIAPSTTVGSTTAARSTTVAEAQIIANTEENGALEPEECRTQRVNQFSGRTRVKRKKQRRRTASLSSQQLDGHVRGSNSLSATAEVLEAGKIRREWDQPGAAALLSLPAREERAGADDVGEGEMNRQTRALHQHGGRGPEMFVPGRDARPILHGVVVHSREEDITDAEASSASAAAGGGDLGEGCNPEQFVMYEGGDGGSGESSGSRQFNMNDTVKSGWFEESLANEHEQREDAAGMEVEEAQAEVDSTRQFDHLLKTKEARIQEHQENGAVRVVAPAEEGERNKEAQDPREVAGSQIPAGAGMEFDVTGGGAGGTAIHRWLSEGHEEVTIANDDGGIVVDENIESGRKWAAYETATDDDRVP